MAVDQQGGRSDGAIPVDGKPGTVNGGEEQDLPHGWLVRHILQPQEVQCRGKTARSYAETEARQQATAGDSPAGLPQA